MPSFDDQPAQPGWYPDPGGSASHRYWDGSRWTDALSSAIPPAGPNAGRDDSRSWALAAHLSAPVSMIVALAFLGPLIVYLVKKDDPFVRRHAAEALNFNLSFLLYAVLLGMVTIVDCCSSSASCCCPCSPSSRSCGSCSSASPRSKPGRGRTTATR